MCVIKINTLPEPLFPKPEMAKYKIYITEQQVKILNSVDRYMSKHNFISVGNEYVSQSNAPQVGMIDLVFELANIYCEYTEKG